MWKDSLISEALSAFGKATATTAKTIFNI